ncbi:hypothetical protein M422DRAFT_170821 [Sphaerobolus stellatus SS14]|uniref:Unplaced genomic scaffold SPHSTscaffold_53, whole genome shotgun sequence n=1 Tax=Sphaerobolus stellatus (strain SS14) TaxID=990650 RepID=A0A0C9UI39_SPHS4|nr:hypothetical protein M422DRAFT_170821 [Sphaerobolus stellatus SS14]
MANIIRTAKSGSDWTVNELDAYNITIVSQDLATFFGSDVLPLPAHHPDLVDKVTADEMEDEDSYQVARYMDLAMNPIPGEESAVDDFVMQLLRTIRGYAGRAVGRDLRSRKDIPFLICGEWRHAKIDVCVMDRNEILLLVQEDKRHMELGDPHSQLIAEAIAAVQSNNRVRDHLGLDILDFKEMAGIVMIGTSPTFFKVPVTRDLMQAVQRGQYPSTPTVVAMHRPILPRPLRRLSEGMRHLDNRRAIIACFEAFKQFVN